MLALDDVSVTRGGTPVLQRVTASFPAGRCTAVAGPSGAGKSTLLRLLNRLQEPSSGRVLLHDRPLPSYPVREVRRKVGLVQQAPVVLGDDVLADLRTGRPGLTEGEAEELLSRAGLQVALDRTTADLSGGEAQRLCLARALVVGPEVLLLDEPTSALDAVAAQAVEGVVLDLVASGLAVVLVSHDDAQTQRLADDVVALEHGRLV